MNNKKKKADIYLEYILNDAVDTDIQIEIESFLAKYPEYRERFSKAEKLRNILSKSKLEKSVNTAKAWEDFSAKLSPEEIKSPQISPVLKYAAAILLPLMIGMAWLYGPGIIRNLKQNQYHLSDNHTIEPGSSRALLKLASGTTIKLDSLPGSIREEDGTSIVYNREGVSYIPSGKQVEEKYNTLEIPIGGEYFLTLSDGTKVWLNSQSSLRYPTQFKTQVRTVYLEGEAYFEIANNKLKPFDVVTDELTVRALGTAFNIMAYRDEKNIQTTLVNGRVQILSEKLGENTAFLLYPNYQAQYERSTETITQQKVNIENVIAWKNGLFVFEDENIETIMRRLARWYDIEVQFDDINTKEYHFTGSVRRYENISAILDLIRMTTRLNYQIENNRVIISSIK